MVFEDEFNYSYRKFKLICRCGNEEFINVIRDIGLPDHQRICACGSKMKAIFWPYPLAIRLGDSWTTDPVIIKNMFKGRSHEVEVPEVQP